VNDKMLTKFILSYLIEKQDYLELSKKQQQLVFETCRTIMTAIYNAIKHDNVYPIIMCGDPEAQFIISKALESVEGYLPSIDKITVHTIQ
tara:strand:+ start:674 stop:943 length:270 start_codon:yes stop_codon:yes gene_type:complete